MKNKFRLSAVFLALLLCGCNNTQTHNSSAGTTAPTHTNEAATVEENTSEISVDEPLPSGEQTSHITDNTADTTEQSVEEKTSDEAHTVETASEENGETVQSPPSDITAEATTPAVTTTTTAATTATTSAATTAAVPAIEEPPAEVIIPQVKVPLSPGVDTVSNEKATLDFSNAGEGYISVYHADTGKRVKLRIICGDSVYDHDVTAGVTEYFPLSCGSGAYKIQLYEQTEGSRFAKSLEGEINAVFSQTAPFSYPNKYVNYGQASPVVKKAAEICAGKNGGIEKTAAIFKWVTDNVTYDKQLAATVQSGYVPDPEKTLEKKTGICYDYSSLMAAMLRSQGIPTRLVIGYAADNIYHAWNEIWTEESGWITPELLFSKHGFNLTDATFYAGASDKEKIASYISNGGNYSALYYY